MHTHDVMVSRGGTPVPFTRKSVELDNSERVQLINELSRAIDNNERKTVLHLIETLRVKYKLLQMLRPGAVALYTELRERRRSAKRLQHWWRSVLVNRDYKANHRNFIERYYAPDGPGGIRAKAVLIKFVGNLVATMK